MDLQYPKTLCTLLIASFVGLASLAQAKPPTQTALIVTLTCGYDAAIPGLVVEAVDASDRQIAADVAVGDLCIESYALLHARVARASNGDVDERMQAGELAGSPATTAPDCIIFDIVGSGDYVPTNAVPTRQVFLTCGMGENGGLELLEAESNLGRLASNLDTNSSCAAARAGVVDLLVRSDRNARISRGEATWFRSFDDSGGVVLHRIGLE